MTNGTSLSCVSATAYVYDNVKFISIICSNKRLTNDNFQSLKTQILVNVTFVDGDLTCSRYQIYSGNGCFSSSCSGISISRSGVLVSDSCSFLFVCSCESS